MYDINLIALNESFYVHLPWKDIYMALLAFSYSRPGLKDLIQRES